MNRKHNLNARNRNSICLRMDKGWCEVDDVQSVQVSSGTMHMKSGATQPATVADVVMKNNRLDDGQSAFKACLERGAQIDVRINNAKTGVALYAVAAPFADGVDAKRPGLWLCRMRLFEVKRKPRIDLIWEMKWRKEREKAIALAAAPPPPTNEEAADA